MAKLPKVSVTIEADPLLLNRAADLIRAYAPEKYGDIAHRLMMKALAEKQAMINIEAADLGVTKEAT